MIKFVKTRWHYDSYTDFWKLVELSGFPFCYVDEVDIHNKEIIYIVSPYNGEWMEFMNGNTDDIQAELICWNLERPGGAGGVANYIRDNKQLVEARYFHRIIVSDMNLARDTGFHFVPLGTHKGLGEPTPTNTYKPYDLIHLSCYTPHRATLFATPESPRSDVRGLKIAPNAWGDERDKLLRRTKAMLSVHQDGLPYCEPLRLSLATAYGLILIWEECNTLPYTTIQFPLGGLSTDKGLVRSFDLFKSWLIGIKFEELEDRFLEHRKYMIEKNTFRKCLERSL